MSGQQSPVQFNEIALGGSAARSEFEIYVPGVIILSVILVIFQAAISFDLRAIVEIVFYFKYLCINFSSLRA